MPRAIACAFVLFVMATTAPAASGAPPAQPQSDILQLVSQTPFVQPDGDMTLRLRVTGSPSGARVQVQVHGRVPTRSDFKASIAGKVLRSAIGAPVVVPAAPDPSGTVVTTVKTHDPQSSAPADAQAVRLGEGVYPVTVDLVSSSGANLDSLVTYLVRVPVSHDFGPLGVAIVLPIGGP